MKNILFCASALIVFLLACEKSDLNSETTSANRPVVESYLQPGAQPLVLVKKQILYGESDSIQLPIKDLNIVIEVAETTEKHTLTHADSSAYVGSGWQVQSGKTYRLSFDYDGKTIEAETSVPSKPTNFRASAASIKPFVFSFPPTFPDPIELTWDAPDGGYYLVVVETAESNPELVNEDTDFTPPFSFRSEPEQTDAYSLEGTAFQYYGTHRVILYHLNAEYAALYEDSGSNSTNLTTPYSNVKGGLGIFTGVNADTIMIEVTK
jgi:Domain of unknown function (DUF4249)